MIAALLLPHSGLLLTDLTPLLPHQPSPDRVAHQLRRLATTPNGTVALRILTELGLALDHHDIPIDYARRRRLVTDTELIDRPTWIRLCRHAGLHIGRERRLDLARRYLYELLTGGNLATAPEPYRLDIGAPRVDHAELCAAMPATLVVAPCSCRWPSAASRPCPGSSSAKRSPRFPPCRTSDPERCRAPGGGAPVKFYLETHQPSSRRNQPGKLSVTGLCSPSCAPHYLDRVRA